MKDTDRKNHFEDDGRQIADMSGIERTSGIFSHRKEKIKNGDETSEIKLTAAEKKRLVLSSVFTSAVISPLFIAAAAAIIALIYFLG